MPKSDPFNSTFVSDSTLLAIVKNMERRWGLTLVSFLPPAAQEQIVQLQRKISSLWDKSSDDGMRQGRLYVEFYYPEQFHCTHLTLTRSDPREPVQADRFVKKGHRLFDLFKTIHDVTFQVQPFDIKLDRMRMAHDGFGIVLVGECASENSVETRQTLLKSWNETLSESVYLQSRSWDTRSSDFHKLHCSLGCLKRSMPQGYKKFASEIERIDFAPLSFTFENIALVHHRYRTLAFPQEGCVILPLGEQVRMTEDEFIRKLNLA